MYFNKIHNSSFQNSIRLLIEPSTSADFNQINNQIEIDPLPDLENIKCNWYPSYGDSLASLYLT